MSVSPPFAPNAFVPESTQTHLHVVGGSEQSGFSNYLHFTGCIESTMLLKGNNYFFKPVKL